MAYHLSADIVSRGKGHSMVAKAAYNSRDSITEERTGELKDYSRHRDKPLASFVFVNDSELREPGKLWNFYDRHETRSNAQLGYSFIAALPHQLTDEQREHIVKDFMREQFLRKGVGSQADIHRPERHGDDRNYHVHILVSMRKVGKDGLGEKVFTWDDRKKNLAQWREKWAERAARELEKNGHTQEAERWRYGHLTNKQQRQKALERGDTEWANIKAREATHHLGPAANGMERRGEQSDRGELNREANHFNAHLAERDELDKAIDQERQQHGGEEIPSSPAPARQRGTPVFVQDILLSDRATWWQRGALQQGQMSRGLAQELNRKLEQHRYECEQQAPEQHGPPAERMPDVPEWPEAKESNSASHIAPPTLTESRDYPTWPETSEDLDHVPDIEQDTDIDR